MDLACQGKKYGVFLTIHTAATSAQQPQLTSPAQQWTPLASPQKSLSRSASPINGVPGRA